MAKAFEKKYRKDELISGVQDQVEAIRSNKVGFVSQVATETEETLF